jgi:hypothetical protein
VGHSAKYPLTLSPPSRQLFFVECPIKNTRQRGLCRRIFCRVLFAERGTRQSLCRVELHAFHYHLIIPQPWVECFKSSLYITHIILYYLACLVHKINVFPGVLILNIARGYGFTIVTKGLYCFLVVDTNSHTPRMLHCTCHATWRLPVSLRNPT